MLNSAMSTPRQVVERYLGGYWCDKFRKATDILRARGGLDMER